MRAFAIAGKAIVSCYNDLFVFISMSLLWWVTGGFFAAGAVLVALVLFAGGGPVWIAPVVAIPAGPAVIALASVTRQTVRGRAADRRDYFEALRTNWKAGLALNALGMVVLALLLLNLIFYSFQASSTLRLLSALWGVLVLFWSAILLYVYPFYLALEKPNLGHSLRMAALAAFANPLFSVLLLVLALILTGLSVVLPVLLLVAWPALMALLGENALRLLLERAGVKQEGGEGN
jgi:uncharacterized membrane protein YesL